VRWVLIILGVVAIALGGLWTLQGLDIVGGSGMSGHKVWAIIGPLVALVGLFALVRGVRRGGGARA